MPTSIEQFTKQSYLNIETFRKNGAGIKTPVWFVLEGDQLRLWTGANSGKVKRIRRDGHVRLVPATVGGEPLGQWVDGAAAVLDDDGEINRTAALFRKKYGLQFSLFVLGAKLRGMKPVTIQVRLA